MAKSVGMSADEIAKIAGDLGKCVKSLESTAENMRTTSSPIQMLPSKFYKMMTNEKTGAMKWIVRFTADLAGAIKAAQTAVELGGQPYQELLEEDEESPEPDEPSQRSRKRPSKTAE